MSRLDEIKARAEQVHWTSTSIEQAMARMASSAADVPWLASEVDRLTAERDALQVGRDRDRAKGATAVLNEELRTSEQEARARRAEAEVERLTVEREWFKDRFPCDGGCVDAPEEACSRHGRNPADLWRIIGEVTAGRDAQTKRAERLERWYADALTMLDKSRRWKSIASLTAERDSLAARLALVEALAEAEVERLTAERDALAAAHARESEKVWKVEEVMDDIEGSDPTTWERLRDALSGSGADTSDTQTTDQEVSDE